MQKLLNFTCTTDKFHNHHHTTSGGIKNYNIEMNYMDGKWKTLGIVTNDRENVHFLGFHKDVTQFQWLSDEELRKFLDDREIFDLPSCPYKLQPENQVIILG